MQCNLPLTSINGLKTAYPVYWIYAVSIFLPLERTYSYMSKLETDIRLISNQMWTPIRTNKHHSNEKAYDLIFYPLLIFRPDLIQVLIMDHNPVKTLPPRAFHLTGLINVQKVFLKNCSLNDLDPTALAGLVILIELDLSENKIKELKQGTFQVW